MRFYDKDLLAVPPNVAVMPFGAGPYRRFVGGDGLSAGAIPARPALLIHVLTAKRCSLAARLSIENLNILASPVGVGEMEGSYALGWRGAVDHHVADARSGVW
jgi:hypothetical protein